MKPDLRTPAAALTRVAAVVAMAGLAASSAGSAAASRHSGPPDRLDVGGSQLAGTGIVVNYPSAATRRLPRVPASAYVIADAATGQVLAARDPHGFFPPASTLKVLTAITLIPLLSPDAMVITSRRAASVQPNVVGLVVGRRYQVAALFKALLLISANDAAVALAEASGSFDRGVALMNAQAHRLQAYDVVARQPNGLPAAGQHASAYDEALIARQALSMPAFMKYDSLLAARFPVKRRKWVTLVNQNALLTDYRGGIGGKIGWTVRAKATYIGMARRNGVTLIVTVLHCAPLQEITSAERLLNWGFAMDGKVRPVGVLVPPLRAPAAAHSTSPPQPAPDPGSATPGTAGTRPATPGTAGPGSATPGTAGPGSAGQGAAGPRTAGPGPAGLPGTAGPGSAGRPGRPAARGARGISAALAVGSAAVAVTVICLLGLLARARRRRSEGR
jgi:serine-type D-Ala-D-Ala carboxypeptidase (penicillin-binding protein 5/6)